MCSLGHTLGPHFDASNVVLESLWRLTLKPQVQARRLLAWRLVLMLRFPSWRHCGTLGFACSLGDTLASYIGPSGVALETTWRFHLVFQDASNAALGTLTIEVQAWRHYCSIAGSGTSL